MLYTVYMLALGEYFSHESSEESNLKKKKKSLNSQNQWSGIDIKTEFKKRQDYP